MSVCNNTCSRDVGERGYEGKLPSLSFQKEGKGGAGAFFI